MANSVTKLIKFEPLATLAATNVLGDSIVAGLAWGGGWSGKAVVLITLIWHNAVNVVGSLFARAGSTPNAQVDQVANGKATGIINDLVTLQNNQPAG